MTEPVVSSRRGQRRLALAVLLGAAALAVAAYPFRAHWAGGLVLAIAEAGVVGGLADWFAVTALFRRPLGLPIPHTALIPANWQLMAARVGSMVGGRVLTTEYVTREIARVDVADLLREGASRVTRDDVEVVLRTVTRWAADQFEPASTAELVAWLQRLLRHRPIAPLLADLLDVAHRHGWDERMIEALARALADTLDRADVREALSELLDDVVGRYRERMGFYPGVLIGLANLFGLIDLNRLVSALQAALDRVAADPNDPLRVRISKALRDLPARLRADPLMAARVDDAKETLLASAAATQLLEDAAAGLHRALVADVGRERSELVTWIANRVEDARQALIRDQELRETIERWLKARAAQLVESYQERVAAFI